MRRLVKTLPFAIFAAPACDGAPLESSGPSLEVEVSGPIVRYDLPWDIGYTVDFRDRDGRAFQTVTLDDRYRASADAHLWVQLCDAGALRVEAEPDFAPVDGSPELLYPARVGMDLQCPGGDRSILATATVVPASVVALSRTHTRLAFGTFACDVTTTCDAGPSLGLACRDVADTRAETPLTVGLSETRVVCADGRTAAFAPFGRSTAASAQVEGIANATQGSIDWSLAADRALDGCAIEALVTVMPLDAAALGHTPACTAWPSFRVTIPAGSNTCGTTAVTAEWSDLQGFGPEQFLSSQGKGLRTGAPANDARCAGGEPNQWYEPDPNVSVGSVDLVVKSVLPTF